MLGYTQIFKLRYLTLFFTVGLLSGCVAQDTYLAKEQEARHFKSDLEEIRNRYSKLKEQYRDLENVKQKLDSKGEEISAQLDKALSEKREKSEEIKRLTKEIQELKKILSAKSDTLSNTVADLMSKLDSIEVEKISLGKELAGYKDLLTLRDAEIQGLKRKYETKAGKLLSDLDQSQKQTKKMEQKFEKTKAKLVDLEKERNFEVN
jgi:chromosome segregation ATPase